MVFHQPLGSQLAQRLVQIFHFAHSHAFVGHNQGRKFQLPGVIFPDTADVLVAGADVKRNGLVVVFMVKLNDIFVFVQKTELEKFDSETDAFIIFQFVFETFFVAESRTVDHLDGFAVEKDFFITDI